VGNKFNIKNYINTIRYYLKKEETGEETEESSVLTLADNLDDTESLPVLLQICN